MARLRDGYEEFTGRGAVALAVGPNPPSTFQQYWRNERIPFIGLQRHGRLPAATAGRPSLYRRTGNSRESRATAQAEG